MKIGRVNLSTRNPWRENMTHLGRTPATDKTNPNPGYNRTNKGEPTPRTRAADKTSSDGPSRNRARQGQFDQFLKRYDDPIKLTQEQIEAMRNKLSTGVLPGGSMPTDIYRAINGKSIPGSPIA